VNHQSASVRERRDADRALPTLSAVDRPTSGGRLLLVSYSFPPDRSVGALRWQKLTRYAAERGLALDVVALSPHQYDAVDVDRLADVPGETRIVHVSERAGGSRRLHGALLALRRSIRRGSAAERPSPSGHASTDAASSRGLIARLRYTYLVLFQFIREWNWANDARAAAARIADPAVHRAIVSSGPPHMAHVAASRVARAAGLPHVVDLRDPWSLAEHDEHTDSLLYRFITRFYERGVFRRARLVVANTELARQSIAELYPEIAPRTITVMNGSDEDDEPPRSQIGARFVIAFAGSLYVGRSPIPLFRATAKLVEELELSPTELGIEFMGGVAEFAGEPVSAIAERLGVGAFLTLHPSAPRAVAREFLARAAMLVSLPQESRLAVPAKIFEYAQYPAWLLVIEERETATELALRDSGADVVAPDDIAGITAVLRQRLLDFRAGRFPCGRSAGTDRAVGPIQPAPSGGRALRGDRPAVGASSLVRGRGRSALPYLPAPAHAVGDGDDDGGLQRDQPDDLPTQARRKENQHGRAQETDDEQRSAAWRPSPRQRHRAADEDPEGQERRGNPQKLVEDELQPHGIAPRRQDGRKPRAELKDAGERANLPAVLLPRVEPPVVHGTCAGHERNAVSAEHESHRHVQVVQDEPRG
jgi:glycosyltransferase involved in cell wall biosynthesis